MKKQMKIAIPVWQNSVSTVFDFANKLLLAEVGQENAINRMQVDLPDEPLPQKISRLRALDVDLLICGAISQPLAFMVMGAGIEVLPYVTGQIDDVLEAYISGRLMATRFLMPGCKRRKRRCFGRSNRWCR
jgi:predicted Fe-Mo cluster-binding NifX family protein